MNTTNLSKILLTLALLVPTSPLLFAQNATGNDDQQHVATVVVATNAGNDKNNGAKNNGGKHEEVMEDLDNRIIKPVFGNSVSGGDQEGSDGFGNNDDDEPMAGDANGDGKLTLADAAAIISYLNNRTPSKFNNKAADADGNNVINLNDLEMVINSLLK